MISNPKSAATLLRYRRSAGGNHSGQDVDELACRAALGQSLDDRANGRQIALTMRPRVTRGGNGNACEATVAKFLSEIVEVQIHIVANGFGQTGRRDADELGIVLANHIGQRFAQIVFAPRRLPPPR